MNKHIKSYIEYFKSDKNITLKYFECTDIITVVIRRDKVTISYDIKNATDFCTQMLPNDFRLFIIDETLSVFNLVNARNFTKSIDNKNKE